MNITQARDLAKLVGTSSNPNMTSSKLEEMANAFMNLFNNEDPKPLVYKALITQSGTSAPTAIVLENTIGDIVWTRSAMGVYLGTLSGAFTANKTAVHPVGFTDESSISLVASSRVSANSVRIATINTSGDPADSRLDGGVILIEVYP